MMNMQLKQNKKLVEILLHPMIVAMMLVGMFMISPQGTAHAVGAVIYVKADANGANDGSSWTDAFTSLQAALSASVNGSQIWVAKGTYYPATGTDRTASFTLKNGVSIYGGFAGTEDLLVKRNLATNITILSGDIGTFNDISDNSYHVVSGSGTDSTAVLDGFTIKAGNANLLVIDGTDQYGGGMYNDAGSPTLSNLIFNGNKANYGAGMFNDGSSPTLTNVTFSSNSAARGAGMYNTLNSSPVLINVTFSNNSALSRGGGMANSGSNPVLTNVTFKGNSADYGGAMSSVTGSNPELTNVTISGNSAAVSGGGVYNNENSNATITNTILYGNSGGQIFNESGSTAVVTYSAVQGGYSGTGNIDGNPLLGPLSNYGGFTQTMALMPGSPAINVADDANCPSTDQRGVTRPQGSHCDIGAYEYEGPSGADTTGVFRPSNGALSLKNSNTTGFADIQINYGWVATTRSPATGTATAQPPSASTATAPSAQELQHHRLCRDRLPLRRIPATSRSPGTGTEMASTPSGSTAPRPAPSSCATATRPVRRT
jgi:hypothetical protein